MDIMTDYESVVPGSNPGGKAMNFERVRKAVAAAVGLSVPVIAAFSTAIADGKWDEQEIGVFVSAVLALVGGTYAVWRVPNEPEPPSEAVAHYGLERPIYDQDLEEF